jgi:hypothetical protein
MLALIVPIDPATGHPAHPIHLPPGINIPAFPTNPIAPGGSPPGVNYPAFPTHPIFVPPGTPPTNIWPPMVDNTLPAPPGSASPPVVLPPGFPVPPIVLPTPPDMPPGMVSPPIALPPGHGSGKALVLVYVPAMGWRWVVVDPQLQPSQPIAPVPEPKKP